MSEVSKQLTALSIGADRRDVRTEERIEIRRSVGEEEERVVCLMAVGEMEEVEEVWRWMLACFVRALVSGEKCRRRERRV